MAKWKCSICGHIYDENTGDPVANVPPGTAFGDLPDGWVCPVCGAAKSMFVRVEEIVFGKRK